MLRFNFILGSCLLCHTLIAQNWQLFPSKQVNHYQVDTETPAIRSFNCDSIIIRAESITHFFKRYSGASDTCYWQNWEVLSYMDGNEDFYIDSLVYTNDQAIYYFTLEEYPFEFVFRPFAKPGEVWDLSSHLSRTGTCISAGIRNILGIEDSVKTFSLQTADGYVDFILSKTYGLIQFIPFIDFFLDMPTKNSTVFPYYNLIGFHSDTKTRGFQFPGFADYFHLSAGDLLLWRYYFYDVTDYTTHYHRDSILISTLNPDSVKYDIHRKIYDINAQCIGSENITVSYHKNEYDYLLVAPAKWHVTKDNEEYPPIYFIDDAIFIFSDTDTAVIKEFSQDGCSFMNEADECVIVCLCSDYDIEYRVSTVEGLTYFKNMWGPEQELLGSVIDGVERGSMRIPVSLRQFSGFVFRVYPNPTSDIIYLTNENEIAKIEIYNSLGILIYHGEGRREINLGDHAAGCYSVLIHSNTGQVFMQKIILMPL